SESAYAAAVRISTAPWVKRCPKDVSPTIVSASSFASTHRTGRAKRIPLSSQRIDFVNEKPRTIRSICSGRVSRRSRPGTVTPRKPSLTSSSSTETPCFFAKPAAALSRRLSGGPLTHWSAVRSGRSSIRNASRRGPMKSSDGAAPMCARASSGSWASASRQAPAGSSSAPISSSSDGIFLLGSEIGRGHVTRKLANAADVRGSLRHRDRPTRVEQVERVRTLQHLVVGRKRQPALEQVSALRLVLVETTGEHVDRRLLEVVPRPLALVLKVDVAPRDAWCPLELKRRPLALEEHRQPFETVGHLGGNELDVEAPELLEVGPLRDFHPVAPDLPAEAPRAERRLLPVVLDEAHVVAAEIDAEHLERGPVEVEHVFRRRLEHNLVLEVMLEPERVLAVAAVERPDHGLDIGDVPRLRAEATEKGVRIHRAGRQFRVVRLHQDAAVIGPVPLERDDHLLVVHVFGVSHLVRQVSGPRDRDGSPCRKPQGLRGCLPCPRADFGRRSSRLRRRGVSHPR